MKTGDKTTNNDTKQMLWGAFWGATCPLLGPFLSGIGCSVTSGFIHSRKNEDEQMTLKERFLGTLKSLGPALVGYFPAAILAVSLFGNSADQMGNDADTTKVESKPAISQEATRPPQVYKVPPVLVR